MPTPLTFAMKVGSFLQPTSATTLAITGVGFTPKAVILFLAGNDAANAWAGSGSTADQLGLSVSMFTAEDAAALYEASDDGGADVRHGIHQTAIRFERADGAFIYGEASLVSMDADGFTLEWTEAFGFEHIIGYIALGGEYLVAKLVDWTMPAFSGTGEHTVSEVGFRPELVIHMFGHVSLLNFGSDAFFEAFRIGAMDASGNQWALGLSRNTQDPTNCKASFVADHVMYAPTPNAVPPELRAEFVAMTEDGFELRFHGHAGGSGRVVSLALAGINARVGTLDKPATTQPQVTTGIGFEPDGLILATAMGPFGTADGILASLGAGSSSTSRGAVARIDRDNVSPAESLKRTQVDKILYGPDSETTHADLTSLDMDGWTLAWTTDDAGTFKVGYIALGLPPRFTAHRFDMELNGLGNGWTEVTEDVLLESPGVSLQYGIAGTGPLDLVASTGTMSFGLINGEENSAGKPGYYSPRHHNCRPGFRKGIRFRYTYLIPGTEDGYGKFVGRIRDVDPLPGRYRDQKTICVATDWMNEAAITKFNTPTLVNEKANVALATVVALVPRQPDSTDFDVSDSTFPFAFDNGLTEESTVLTEIQRICQSEYGRGYMHGGLNYWGRLFFEKRTKRLTPLPIASFDGTMQDLDGGDTTAKTRNKAKVTAHPRRVDAVNTIVLFAKPSVNNPAVTPGQTIRISGRYVDPSNPNARVGGTDMIVPTATTDYLMNSVADGSGSNLTANFTVTATYGANQVDYAITNNGGTTGYVTKLQARGRGLYDYDPLEAEQENLGSIDLIGESLVTLDMPYQSEYTVAKAIAEFLVDTWSSHEQTGEAEVSEGSSTGVTEISIKRIPRDVDELTALMAIEPGDAVVVIEDLSVVNDVYFVQSVDLDITGDKTVFEFGLQRALVQDYWTLGTAGFSELGETTVLAPL